MTDSGDSQEEAGSERLRAHEQAIQSGDAEALRAAQQELQDRLAKHGLSPAEALLLGQITMAQK